MNKDQLAVLIKERNIQIVDMKFVDLPGLWQHFTVPIGQVRSIGVKLVTVDSAAPPTEAAESTGA